MDMLSNYLLEIYVYSHRLVLLSALVRELVNAETYNRSKCWKINDHLALSPKWYVFMEPLKAQGTLRNQRFRSRRVRRRKSPGHDMAMVLMSSLHLWLLTQDLHQIKPADAVARMGEERSRWGVVGIWWLLGQENRFPSGGWLLLGLSHSSEWAHILVCCLH